MGYEYTPIEWALNTVIGYEGLYIILKDWVTNSKGLSQYTFHMAFGDDVWDEEEAYHQAHFLWMIAVMLYGNYGTSPRYGWIDNVSEFQKWCEKIGEMHFVE